MFPGQRWLIMPAVLMLGCGRADTGEVEAVKKVVLEAQEAGWARYDFKAYMEQWSDDAKIEVGRAEKAGKHDYALDRKQIEATRRILMSGRPEDKTRMTFDDVKVMVKGDEAELCCRTTLYFGAESYQRADEVYRLRKTKAGWKVYLNRGWFVENRFGDEVTRFDKETWDKLDAAAEAALAADKLEEASRALGTAQRPRDALKVLRKLCADKEAPAIHWLDRGYTALAIGETDEALSAFRRALELDPKLTVPALVREKK